MLAILNSVREMIMLIIIESNRNPTFQLKDDMTWWSNITDKGNGSILRPGMSLNAEMWIRHNYKWYEMGWKSHCKTVCILLLFYEMPQYATLQIWCGVEAIFILSFFPPVPLSFTPFLVFISHVTLARPGPRLPCYLNDVLMLVKHYCEWLSSIEAVLARRVNISWAHRAGGRWGRGAHRLWVCVRGA